MDSTSSSPRAKGFEFVPEYAVEDGVSHTFNGTLYVPTPEEFERIESEQAARDTAPRINPVCLAEKAVHRPFAEQWTTKRVKMSAGELIRLAAAKPRD